ncbi:hypothetical protein EYF80_059982 [Liparis tanakae]|uniref:Uncharacterized protein n=1 Tax=Liparis tanakae TaxID=230148 RepID=A0A4Z2ELN5_9TELE|nr:hypothetical protein EYF80_059982 [Liparis tanakae]
MLHRARGNIRVWRKLNRFPGTEPVLVRAPLSRYGTLRREKIEMK